MLIIQIKDGQDKSIAVINNIFSLQVDDEVNKGGKIKLKIPIEKRLQSTELKKGYRININYGIRIGKIVKLFDGYITDITLKSKGVEIQAENWLSYLQNRIVRGKKTFSNVEIKTVVEEIYNNLNNTFPLPFSLGLNDCETKISREFDTGTSFYDILKYCWTADKDLIVRILDGELEVSENTGNILEGVWEYDVRNTRATNLSDWSWKDTLDNFYSYLQNKNGSDTNTDFNEEIGLIFERYEGEGSLALPTGDAIPSVSVNRDTDWRNFNIGDRKQIRLFTGYDWLMIEYLGLIQSRKITINANNGIKAEIKVSEKYKEETNILDLVLTNLRKK